jgi:pimeloyl-ACP methyl ester carboxylesterase
MPVDGFRLAYEREGTGPAVVLLHGWPGDHADYRAVTPLLSDHADVLVPDLRGFGASDKHPEDPASAYSAEAQARSVLGLIDELGLHAPVIAGYDIGSRIAQTIARTTPDLRTCDRGQPAAARRGRASAERRRPARVLVPGVPPARFRRRAPRRQAHGHSRLPSPLLVALVRARVPAAGSRSRSACDSFPASGTSSRSKHRRPSPPQSATRSTRERRELNGLLDARSKRSRGRDRVGAPSCARKSCAASGLIRRAFAA